MGLGMLRKTQAWFTVAMASSAVASPAALAQALPPPPPAAAPAAQDAEDADVTLEPGDPKPETVGGAMIVCGWIAFGIGVTAVLGELTSSSNANGLTRQANESSFVLSGGLTAVGLTVALIGHMRRADSNAQLEEWRLRHPDAYESKRAPHREPAVQWTLAPAVGPRWQGFGLAARF